MTEGQIRALVEAEVAKQLQEIFTSPLYQEPSLARIVDAVARHFIVLPSQIMARCRTARFTTPRQVCYYLAVESTGLSYSHVGRAFGRHHTTVLGGVQRIRRLMRVDADLAVAIGELMDGLNVGESLWVSRHLSPTFTATERQALDTPVFVNFGEKLSPASIA